MATTFELALADPVPDAVATVVGDRFEGITVGTRCGGTFLHGRIADQAALRALLDLVWDMGCAVLLLRVTPPSRARPPTGDGASA